MTSYVTFCGLDITEQSHHLCALDPSGQRLYDGVLPTNRQQLDRVLTDLAGHGQAVMVVDQPTRLGAVPCLTARDHRIHLAYSPTMASDRLGQLNQETDHTPAEHAFTVADAARTAPDTILLVDITDDVLAELTVLRAIDDTLAADADATASRIRELLSHVHPALAEFIGPRLTQKATLALLGTFGGAAGLKAARRTHLFDTVHRADPAGAPAFVNDLVTAVHSQTTVVPGTRAIDPVLANLARHLSQTLDQRSAFIDTISHPLDAYPLSGRTPHVPGIASAKLVLRPVTDHARVVALARLLASPPTSTPGAGTDPSVVPDSPTTPQRTGR